MNNIRQKSSRAARYRNWAGLLAGFVFGQGGFALAGAYLIATDRGALYGGAGYILGLYSLGQWLVDWAGLPWITKRSAEATFDLRCYLSVVVVRMTVAAVLIVAVASLAIFGLNIRPHILLIGALVLVFWSFNLAGVLDARGLSGLAGMLTSLPWLLATSALLYYSSLDYAALLYLAGVLVSCLAMLVGIPSGKPSAGYNFPSRLEISIFFRYGLAYTATYGAGQIYGRLVIGLVGASLDAHSQGAYVFVRSALVCVNQVVSTLRRVEFVDLASGAVSIAGNRALLRVLMPGFAISALMCGAAFILLNGIFLDALDIPLNSALKEALLWIPLFLVTAIFWSVYNGLTNVAVVIGVIKGVFLCNVVGYGLSLLLIAATIETFGLLSIVVIESVFNILMAVYIFSFVIPGRRERGAGSR